MRRFLFFVLLICCCSEGILGVAQGSSSSDQPGQVPAVAQQAPETTSEQVAKAEAAIVKKDWKTAEPLLDSWLAAHPDDGRALFDAGYLADAQGRNEDAVKLYQKAIDRDSKSFDAQVSLGLLLARMNRGAEARPTLEAATKLDPAGAGPAAKARAWRALAEIDVAGAGGKADPAQASIDLLEALKITPETVDDTLLAAHIAELDGDIEAEEAAYRRALKRDSGSALATTGLAHLLIAQKKYPDAEPLLLTALAKTPEDPALTAQLAAVYVAEDKAEALPLLEQFHKTHPGDGSVTRMLAHVRADAGEYAESDQLYMQLLATDSRNSELLSGHGQNLIRLHRYPEAMKAFDDATEADESNGDAWNGLAFAAFELHKPEVTLHALTVRSKYLPENATIYFLWATAYDTLHDKKQAAVYYRRFLETAAGKLPDQEWQARQRLKLLDKSP